MRMPGQTRPGAAASLLLCIWVVVMMMEAMMLLPSLVPMLWRYSARPYDRTGKNPEVLIGFFAKNAISRLQKVLLAKI
jgi:predicted metal-binding membrane protein